MFRTSRSVPTILLLLAFVLLVPSSAAEAAPVEETAWSFNLKPWDWATRLWSALGQLWAEGATIDPDRAKTPSLETAENGCTIDPNGRCAGGEPLETVTRDEGCSIDPDGGCTE